MLDRRVGFDRDPYRNTYVDEESGTNEAIPNIITLFSAGAINIVYSSCDEERLCVVEAYQTSTR